MSSQVTSRHNKPWSLSDLSLKQTDTALRLVSLVHNINMQIKQKARSCSCA
jgi:hypothetical protein